jgi:hypothetical protein
MVFTSVRGSRSVARHRRVDAGGPDDGGPDDGGFGLADPSRSGGWDGRPAQENLFQAQGSLVPAQQSPFPGRARAGRRRGAAVWLHGYRGLAVAVAALVVCGIAVGVDIHASRTLTAGSVSDSAAAPAAGDAPNPNCTLIVPANPLAAKGLATSYQLTAMDPAAGPLWRCG